MLSYKLALFVIFFLFVSVAIADLTADNEGLVQQMDRRSQGCTNPLS
uniref:Candidate secreted effector Minc11888 n=1 Tax=Meloidogyne incognita TaxID=6306 RepID=A0A343JGY6_MELIC|nr:candidate secreted effector Minc11888 [Meloidogyne incognita]